MKKILIETSRGYQAIDLGDYMFKERKIFFTESFTTESCKNLIKQLMYLEQSSKENITIYINSPGGDVTSGLAVYDYIQTMKSPIKTVCIGLAASMASILFLAGTEREMMANSQIMIHDPSYSFSEFKRMNPDEFQRTKDRLDKLKDSLCEIISGQTNLSLEEVNELTDKDSYFDAGQALELGIATSIAGKKKMSESEFEAAIAAAALEDIPYMDEDHLPEEERIPF